MYTRSILERYARTIPNERHKRLFRERFSKIVWEPDNDQLCMGGAVSEVYKGTELWYLIENLNSRLAEFMTDENFKV